MASNKFDDAHWHWNGDYPPELWQDEETNPPGVAHIAFFLAWMVLHNLASEEHYDPAISDIEPLRNREITPWAYMEARVVFRLEDEDFNEHGLAFALSYYRKETPSPYFRDFCRVFRDEETIYHVLDTWENYDRIAPILDAAFGKWIKESGHGALDIGPTGPGT
jgi:hypothetical protein